MNHILLDTNAYVAVVAGVPEARKIVDRAWTIAVNSIVLGELLSGFAVGTRYEKNRQLLNDFLAATDIEILSVSAATAESYASIYQTLRGNGQLIPQNDMWIAVSAVEHSLGLFSYDRHFARIPGLQVGSTVAELGLNAPES